MEVNKSLDVQLRIIAAYLDEAHTSFGVVFNNRVRRLTLQKVSRRLLSEGSGFLTKTLPRLGKHFDQVLSGATNWNCHSIGFETIDGGELPRFLGELFQLVCAKDGSILPDPDANCVKLIREILYLFYKYELPYHESLEQRVISDFEEAEKDLRNLDNFFKYILDAYPDLVTRVRRHGGGSEWSKNDYTDNPTDKDIALVREAKILLSQVLSSLDLTDIVPRHGPGVVATKQKPWEKYLFTNVCKRITDVYPLDAYFFASNGAVCDKYDSFDAIGEADLPARVILVPKDSRGPRLISCEPVDFQWIQQGVRKALYERVESHSVTKYNVFFTDQNPNRFGAYLGSKYGKYATLDLKEASDRIHVDLVRLLFPEHITKVLLATRSESTVLPDGRRIELRKFAPMGSALCFPVLALTIWSLLTAGAPDADTRESILVYGDDVIVPTAYAESAMKILETFGLKINRSKSCLNGSFRESCGLDAFKGVDVTPVRLRTVWTASRSPQVYTSWISYANSFYDRQRLHVYRVVVDMLHSVFDTIPGEDIPIEGCPRLRWSPAAIGDFRRRVNKKLQKEEFLVPVVESPKVTKRIDGWSMLLRYFTEGTGQSVDSPLHISDRKTVINGRTADAKPPKSFQDASAFSVSSYTTRNTSKLVYRWR